MLSSVLTTLLIPTLAFADTLFTLVNNCAVTVNPQFYGTNNGLANPSPLASGASVQVTFNGGFQGYIFPAFPDGLEGLNGATKAGFSLTNNYYYILIDSGFNYGIEILPIYKEEEGYCVPVMCYYANCTTAFSSPPTFPDTASTTAPTSPLYECTGQNTAYEVFFCPGGIPPPPPPPPSYVQIHPNGNTAKCMDVKGNVQANGTPVQIYDCNGTGAQDWVINKANTAVQLSGTNFCLDAGSDPANFVDTKIWTCYENLPAQEWYYTDDNRIAVTNQGLCLDLTNGNLADGNQLQTYQCTSYNTNQIWAT